MHTIHVGDVSITRVLEWSGPVSTVDAVLPESDPETWQANRSWLAPDFWNPADNAYEVNLQTWLIRSGGRTILVDTGAGNFRDRPGLPAFGQLDTDLPGALAELGVAPEDVDVVVNTHLHLDHVGWNTREVDGEWVPTFPSASYLIARADLETWRPHSSPEPQSFAINTNVWAENIQPVVDADQAFVWEGGHVIDDNLWLEPAPGHTAGHAVLKVASGSDCAVLSGDVLHSPIQIVEPGWNSCFCEDPAEARVSRDRLLGWAAEHTALVLPAHFGGHGACEIAREGSRFSVKAWAPFDLTPRGADRV